MDDRDYADDGEPFNRPPLPEGLPHFADTISAAGTPNWTGLKEIADRLGPRFGIDDSDALAMAMTRAIARIYVDQGKLVRAWLDWGDDEVLFLPSAWEQHNTILTRAVELLVSMQEPLTSSVRDRPETEVLYEALQKFVEAIAPIAVHPVPTHSPLPCKGFVMEMATLWPSLTNTKPIAYRDPATREGRGDFWRFVVEACDATGITPPTARSVERWFEERDSPTAQPENEPEEGTPHK